MVSIHSMYKEAATHQLLLRVSPVFHFYLDILRSRPAAARSTEASDELHTLQPCTWHSGWRGFPPTAPPM